MCDRVGEEGLKDEEYKKLKNLHCTRLPVEYKANYSFGDIKGEGILTDISEGGVALRIKQALAIGDELQITCRISSGLILEFSGEVRNINSNIAGIKIKEIDPSIHERFKSHIAGILRIANKREIEEYKSD